MIYCSGIMAFFLKKLKRGGSLRSTIALFCLLLPVSCLLVLLYSGLPEVPLDINYKLSSRTLMRGKSLEKVRLGRLGEMMVAMLPDDLPFTIFVPSEEAFERVLKLQAKNSLIEQKINDTFAILSRVMGFSAVPQHLPSGAVPLWKEVSFDSISGFQLYAWRASDGILVVNNVRSEHVDLRKAELILHIMSGVVMDAEFEQSFSPDYED